MITNIWIFSKHWIATENTRDFDVDIDIDGHKEILMTLPTTFAKNLA